MIFGIFSGAYSDWNVKGYITDREQAEKMCYQHNVKKDYYDDDWYVIPIKEIKVELDNTIKDNNHWNYKVMFDEQYQCFEDDLCVTDYITYTTEFVDDDKKFKTFVGYQDKKSYMIRWSSRKYLEFHDVKKIAKDKLMQYLAEQEGL